MGESKYKRIEEIVSEIRSRLSKMSEKDIEEFATMFGIGSRDQILFVH